MRRLGAGLAALVAVALTLRLAFRIHYDEDIDALRFALGVIRFDAAELRPHAPFYPVYVALAKLCAALGASPQGALGCVGALAGAVVVGATALLGHETLGRRGAILAGLLALGSSFLWLTSEKLLSDMTGAAFTTSALWLCARARRVRAEGAPATHVAKLRTAAMLLLGVGLGARLSYFPIALACLFVVGREEGRFRFAARARDVATGVVVWLVPMIAVAGAGPLLRTTSIQAAGHFTRWGGTVVTVSSPTERVSGIAWGAWASAAGGAWPDAPALRWLALPLMLACLGAALPLAKGLHRRHPEIVIAALAYLVWAALGQNSAHKPRHLLPLVPLFVLAVAAGADRLADRFRAGALVGGAVAALWLADGFTLVRAHLEPSPAAAIVGWLAAAPEPGRLVLTRDLGRMIGEGAPGVEVAIVERPADLVAAVERRGSAGVLITGEALDAAGRRELAARGYTLRPAFARPRSRYVDTLWTELALYEVARLSP